MTLEEKVVDYVMQNPGCSSEDVRRAHKMMPSQARGALGRARRAGLLRKETHRVADGSLYAGSQVMEVRRARWFAVGVD